MLAQMTFYVVQLLRGSGLSIGFPGTRSIRGFVVRGTLLISLFRPSFLSQRSIKSLWRYTIGRIRNRKKKRRRRRRRRRRTRRRRIKRRAKKTLYDKQRRLSQLGGEERRERRQ